ncbi:hypothetical protein PL321_17900 [Caloramator sp. mosi_1]|nr:hypothetical protein [Caloramator sp. mosi_1]WDC84116.1 hypothetical protein PL321_17900 [Caloramator sp. mosi_1]
MIFASGGLDVNGGKLGAYALKVAAYKGSLPFIRPLQVVYFVIF